MQKYEIQNTKIQLSRLFNSSQSSNPLQSITAWPLLNPLWVCYWCWTLFPTHTQKTSTHIPMQTHTDLNKQTKTHTQAYTISHSEGYGIFGFTVNNCRKPASVQSTPSVESLLWLKSKPANVSTTMNLSHSQKLSANVAGSQLSSLSCWRKRGGCYC